jgi:hypothetical protein
MAHLASPPPPRSILFELATIERLVASVNVLAAPRPSGKTNQYRLRGREWSGRARDLEHVMRNHRHRGCERLASGVGIGPSMVILSYRFYASGVLTNGTVPASITSRFIFSNDIGIDSWPKAMRRQSKPMNASRRMIIDPLYEFEEELQRLIVKTHLEMKRGGEVTGPIEGTYGDVYSITLPENTFPRRIAAKCPRIKRFGTSEQARSGIEQVLHELEKTHRAFMVPWINRFFDVQIIHGWPFLLSRFRDGSLEDLISNPLAWTVSDRLASLILVARALRLASDRGITAHQDLKPGNVFFDDLARTGVPMGSSGMHFRIFVGDFGLADAFRDFGRNQGSRPYMAPEQFDVEVADPGSAPAFDVFALAVIACESFLDGRHPSGVVTRDCWPWQRGMAQKWNRESTWREWAKFRDKRHKMPAARRTRAARNASSRMPASPGNANARRLRLTTSSWVIC